MEPDDPRGQASYYHQQPPFPHHHHQSTTTTVSPSNGILQNTDRPTAPHMVYPHSVPSAAVSSPLETVRRKRGRPRKYGTPEQAAAAKRLASSSSNVNMPLSPPRSKRDQTFGVSNTTSKKSQLGVLGNAGQGFTPHIITMAVGEDVAQKIMQFMQQRKHEICILSASGSISNASLLQPATSGGNITYEGRFDILSLCGSYVRTELGGRTGGLSVCLSSNDGQIIGGGVGGPLTAAGPVQVIVGTFQIDTKKNNAAGIKGDDSGSKLASPIFGAPVPSVGFQSAADSSGRIVGVSGSDDQQNNDGSHFMIQPQGMQLTSPRLTDWMGSNDSRSSAAYEFSGRMDHGAHQSPENGDYDQYQD